MKVLHVPYSYFPDPPGGTEVYVGTICRALRRRGHECVVAAPAAETRSYIHDDVPVHRFETSVDLNTDDLYELRDTKAASAFSNVLSREKPDVVHLHALTSAVSPLMVEQAHARSAAVVLSYHTPTVTCQRGTLMRWGATVCDGKMRARTCTACSLNDAGAGRLLAYTLGLTPAAIGLWASRLPLSEKGKTALQMRDLIERRHAATRRFFEGLDHIIAMSNWVVNVLVTNGVAEEKISRLRHSVDMGDRIGAIVRRDRKGPLRLAWLGRCHPSKGLHIAVGALNQAQEKHALDVYPLVQSDEDRHYLNDLRSTANGRVRFREAVPPERVADLLTEYDAIVVPSVTLETGPLVALQALALGVPVIATELPAMSELVRPGQNGVLIAGDDPRHWAKEFDRIARNRHALKNEAGAVSDDPLAPVTAADELAKIYDTAIRSFRQRRVHESA